MAETIDEITIEWAEEGVVVIEELEKVVLNRGAWTTILFRYRERDKKNRRIRRAQGRIAAVSENRGRFPEAGRH